jgi:hypothetical protein
MGHLLVVVKQRLLAQEVRNTFWFGGDDAVMANAQAICDGLRDAWEDNMPGLVDEWTLYEFDVYDKTIPSVPGISFVPTGGALVGTSADDPLPTQIALLATFKAQVAPPNTNRKYLAGFKDDQCVNGLFTGAITGAVEDWAADILDLGTTLTLAIVMEVVLLNEDGTVSGGNPLEYAIARQVPATQRRRRIGIGI